LSLDHAILGFLSERPRSGYDLKVRCFDGFARPLWSADQAQIYRTLERLQRSRLISKSRHRSAGRPDRIVYDITATGRDELMRWLSSAASLPPGRDAFSLQLLFAAGVDDSVLLRLFAADGGVSERSMILRQTAFDGAVARELSTIEWLDDCVEAVRRGALPQPNDAEVDLRGLSGA
jgi:PadR family transcriptional regulator AphA